MSRAETIAAVTALNHVGITVGRLDRSLSFWNELVGLELRGRGEVAFPHLDEIIGLGPTRLAWAELEIPGGGMLELFEYLEPAGRPLAQRTSDPGSVHLCLECEDLDALLGRIQAAGYDSRSETPVTIPLGDWEGFRCVYVVDPDGVTLELVEPPANRARA